MELWQTIQATLGSLELYDATSPEVSQEVALEVMAKAEVLLMKAMISSYPKDNPENDYIWGNTVNAVAQVLVDFDATFDKSKFVETIKKNI